jgi:transposase InsO family protein
MTDDGRTLRMLTLIDEYTRECLAIRVARRLGRYEVIEALADVMLCRGVPEHIRSDNGPEFVAKELRKWLGSVGVGTLYIEPGSPWENGYCQSFNVKLRDECLNGEIFYSLKEAQIAAFDACHVLALPRVWSPRRTCTPQQGFPALAIRNS